MGTVNEDRYMQLFVSPQGSWTILVTKTDGQACIVAAGQNWEKLPALAEAEPAGLSSALAAGQHELAPAAPRSPM